MSRFLPVLPCYPCPHANSCCSKGTNLSNDEARSIADKYGAESVVLLTKDQIQHRFSIAGELVDPNSLWNSGEPEWATALNDRGCVLLEQDGACRIYKEPFYPLVCRMFPWKDLASSDEAADSYLCPEKIDIGN